jgi:hypothetical protein
MVPDRVWSSEHCESRPLPYLRVERSDVTPETSKRGNSILYRFRYIACVPEQPGYIIGRLKTKVFFTGKELSTRIDDTFPVETGQWIVDTNIDVPKDADPGVYTLEASLVAKDVTIYDFLNFTVQN